MGSVRSPCKHRSGPSRRQRGGNVKPSGAAALAERRHGCYVTGGSPYLGSQAPRSLLLVVSGCVKIKCVALQVQAVSCDAQWLWVKGAFSSSSPQP
ncbi:hypothetical protein Q8A73_020056 [Channa argus]|nr:hypothetical protein Q8A73_020056 [Channa argus]